MVSICRDNSTTRFEAEPQHAERVSCFLSHALSIIIIFTNHLQLFLADLRLKLSSLQRHFPRIMK
jgi:hypothetical protein